LNTKFSIKAKLNYSGNIILINKKSTGIHNIDMNMIVFVINEKKLYIFPSNKIFKPFLSEDVGSISYKAKIINFINKNYKELIYNFDELNENQNKIIKNTKDMNIMNYLYNEFIKI
jgi:hypothetical protein